MKIHRHLVISLVDSLIDVFEGGYYADKVIERNLKNNRKWGSRDRKFFAESHYDIVRNWRRLWSLLKWPVPEVGSEISDEKLWSVVGLYFSEKELDLSGLPEWDNLRNLRPLKNSELSLAERFSFPDWIVERVKNELGEERLEPLLKSLNYMAPVHLRTNTLKIDRDSLKKKLAEEDVHVHPLLQSPEGLELVERKNVFITQSFKSGYFEVQDISSQQVAHFMQLEPGLSVVDACAGAGGKSLHIAALLKNKGRLISMDVHERKLEQLRLRSRRAGVDIIQTKLIEGTKTIKRLHESADRVLLDVPCSGLGVVRRNPDTKWKLTEASLEETRNLQREIILKYSKMTQPKGQLIYATCSVLPSENRQQVDWFLAQDSSWELIEDKTISPDREGSDGFYMARLRRKES